jgi:hypothetical protein
MPHQFRGLGPEERIGSHYSHAGFAAGRSTLGLDIGAFWAKTKGKTWGRGEASWTQTRAQTLHLQTAWSWCESESPFKMEIPVEMGFLIFMLVVWYLYCVHWSRKLRRLEKR